jgi:hypothetical protein
MLPYRLLAIALFVSLMLGWSYFIKHVLHPQGPLLTLLIGGSILLGAYLILRATGHAT